MMKPKYRDFLAAKKVIDRETGIKNPKEPGGGLFDFQSAIVKWALRRGRAAIFADCGLGKTPIQLKWAEQIPGRVIIVAPLAVGPQTIAEGGKFGVECHFCREDEGHRITVTNYEMLHHFNPDDFTGIVLDESSILKNHTGKFRTKLIEDWGGVPFRLCATATPAPNDFMELGNHAEFLGVMTRMEMLTMFFVHDGGETQKWRLKGHAEDIFWKWLCGFAVMIRRPSDLGFDDEKFKLPKLELRHHSVSIDNHTGEFLFPMEAGSLSERITARRDSVEERCQAAAELIAADNHKPWLVWCGLNSESETLRKMIPDAVEVKGSDDPDSKVDRMMGFSEGRYKTMITKPSIAGFGMNWQHCARMAFVGLSDSYEQFYQAVRRCWRFGQENDVRAWIVTADTEGAVVKNIERKERDAEKMAEAMVRHMRDISIREIRGTEREKEDYKPTKKMALPKF